MVADMTMEPLDLMSSLKADNAFFDSLVNIIPSDLYVSPADRRTEEEEEEFGKPSVNKKYLKGSSKEALAQKKAVHKASKSAKYQKPETTIERKSRIRKNGEADANTGSATTTPGDWSKGGVEQPNDEADANESENGSSAAPNVNHSSRVEALRLKLQSRIAERQKMPVTQEKEGNISKRAARRAEKLKRIELAKRKNGQQATTKVNNKDSKEPRLRITSSSVIGSGSSTSIPEIVKELTVAGDLEQMDFNQIAGLKENTHAFKNNKSLANLGRKKSLDRLLAEAESKKERLQELKKGDEDDKAKAHNILWGDALKEATGTRVKDDPALIKRKMKKKLKQKEKSAKAWASRLEHVEDKKKERQQIRTHNLEKRKLGGATGANLSSKKMKNEDGDSEDENGGKPKKKGRAGPHSQIGRAGFEGKKSEFLNSATEKTK
jgi:hypothetical protein